MNYTIIEINNKNINYLQNFINYSNKIETFRYYHSRYINIISNHIITCIVLTNDNKEIGYSHIDYDDDNNKYWFGICILEDYQCLGLGKMLMSYIFNNEKIKFIKEIFLTVDIINKHAITLYTKFGFTIIDIINNTYYLMKKIIT